MIREERQLAELATIEKAFSAIVFGDQALHSDPAHC